jgi:hypothetical protein
MADLILEIGGKPYDLPDKQKVTAAQYRSLVEAEEKIGDENPEGLLGTKGIDSALDFYYNLLKPHDQKITKKILATMPAYQLNMQFRLKVVVELLTPPLGSIENENEGEAKASPSESS